MSDPPRPDGAGGPETPRGDVDGTGGPDTPRGDVAGGEVDRGGLQKRAVKGLVWSTVAFGGNKLLVFVATLVLARLLTPRDFGVVAAGLVFVQYLEIVLDLGVGAALIYEQEEGITPRVQTAFTLNLGVCIVLAGLCYAGAPAVARFFRVEGSEELFRALSIYLLLRGLGQIPDSLLKRDMDFRRRTIVDISRGVVRGGVSIVLAYRGLGAWALVLGFLVGEAAATGIVWRLVRFRPGLTLDRSAVPQLLRFGSAVLVLKVVSAISINADYLVVGNRLGPTELGYYTMAYRMPELLVATMLWIFSGVAFPAYSQARALGAAAFRETMLKALRLVTLYGFVLGAGLAVVARDVVVVLYSPKWGPAVWPMVAISLGMAFTSIGYASGDIFPAIGKPGTLVKINVPLAVLQVTAFFVVAHRGITAIALVHLVTDGFYAGIRIVVANRLVGSNLGENFAAMRPGIAATAGMLAGALPARLLLGPSWGSLSLTVAGGVAGCAAGLWLGGREMFGELRGVARGALSR